MATATLSLFPSAFLKDDRPGQKGALRYVGRSAKEPDFEMVKMSDNAQGIVIAIEETPAPSLSNSTPKVHEETQSTVEQAVVPSIHLSDPPQARLKNGPASPRNLARIPSPVPTQVRVPIEHRPRSVSPTAVRLPDSPTRNRAPSPLQYESSPKSHATSPTLIRKGSNASTRTATHSPVMRSMFPRYDPHTSLARQQYYPGALDDRVSPIRSEDVCIAPSSSQKGRQGSRFALPVLEIPSQPSRSTPVLLQTSASLNTVMLSTPQELLDLWTIANGQAAPDAKNTYSVELSWYDFSTPRYSRQC